MKLKQMTLREQVLVMITATVFVGGAYGLLRVKPALKSLADLRTQTEAMQQRLQTETIPEMPFDDIDMLNKKLAEAQADLDRRKIEAAEVEMRLAPVDSQELQLRLSDLALDCNVRIRTKQTLVLNAGAQAAISGATPSMTKRQARRAARLARQDAKESALNSNASGVISPPAGSTQAPAGGIHDLMSQLALGAEFQRSMQTFTLEGQFEGIQQFIEGLDNLPWLVTVLQMEMEAVKMREGQRGPQYITAKLVLQF